MRHGLPGVFWQTLALLAFTTLSGFARPAFAQHADRALLQARYVPVKPAKSEVPAGHDPVHVEVKFRDDLDLELDAARIPAGRGLTSKRAERVLRDLHAIAARWDRVAGIDRARVDQLRHRAEQYLRRAIADFNGYFILTLPPGADAARWMDELNALPEVELASPLPLPVPAPIPGDLTPLQGYLTPGPAGIDAQTAWTIPGGTGSGVTVCDLEYSWNLGHQDLAPVATFLSAGFTASDPFNSTDHGTAVLGEMASHPNGWGTTGAAHGIGRAVAPVYLNGFYALTTAILQTISNLEPGDVMLIEQQAFGPRGDSHFVPAEWSQSVYQAILLAVGNGIHVVEAAGNGGENLDDPIYQTGHAPFLPQNDSGAIMVGAGAAPASALGSDVDRSRLGFTNYGSRVNVQGWGEQVTTTGYGDLYSEGTNLLYTKHFGGTSSASPIVASAVAAIEGVVEAETGLPAHPALLRAVLERTGSPQQSRWYSATTHPIGPRPDLNAALAARHAPLLAAPDAIHIREEETVVFTIQAGDLDGDPMQTLAGFSLPSGSTFVAAPDHRSGTFTWTPARGQAGTYFVAFTATNATSVTATTLITVESIDSPPLIVAPGGFVFEGEEIQISVSASDPNGDPILSFEASGVPDGATFTLGPMGTTGLFVWTPDFAQAGTYFVTLQATSAFPEPGSIPATTIVDMIVTVLNLDRQPVVSAPGLVEGSEGISIQIVASASDPDGEAIELTALGLPPGASYQESPDQTSGTVDWTPGFTQAGSYSIQFQVSNALFAMAITNIRIANVDRPPVITAPSAVHGAEGVAIEFEASAVDPDGDAILEFELLALPPGARFVVNPDPATGRFEWTPEFGQAGTYPVMLSASSADRATPVSGSLRTTAATVEIVVTRGNRSPVAHAGGPYSGLALAPLLLDGTASSDPDGDPLSYRWDFGDGTSGSGPQPAHAFPTGVFTVSLTVSDGTLSDTAQTSATIHSIVPARSYMFGGGGVLRLVSGRPTACFQIEPVNAFFEIRSIDLSTVTLSSIGTGSVSLIQAIEDKSAVGADRDRNGIEEVTACFAKTDLRRLFDALGGGRSTVLVTLAGRLTGGGEFRSNLALEIFQSNALEASVSPNPVQEQATLSFRTTVPGTARVSVYDVSGRLLGVVLEDSSIPAGYHDVVIGRTTLGRALSIGVYFYRIETKTDATTGRFSVIR